MAGRRRVCCSEVSREKWSRTVKGSRLQEREAVSDKRADMHAPHRPGLHPLAEFYGALELRHLESFTARPSLLDQQASDITPIPGDSRASEYKHLRLSCAHLF